LSFLGIFGHVVAVMLARFSKKMRAGAKLEQTPTQRTADNWRYQPQALRLVVRGKMLRG
jgi:hypothetical protein